MQKIQEKFQWGTWESSPFTQCGVKVTQTEDSGFILEQKEFLANVQAIHLTRARDRQRSAPTTEAEKSQMRAVLGSLSWVCDQVNFAFSADVGFLMSTVPQSTVADIV